MKRVDGVEMFTAEEVTDATMATVAFALSMVEAGVKLMEIDPECRDKVVGLLDAMAEDLTKPEEGDSG